MTTDRSPWPTRKLRLDQEGRDERLEGLTPGRLVQMACELTLRAWEFQDAERPDDAVQRDAVRVARLGPLSSRTPASPKPSDEPGPPRLPPAAEATVRGALRAAWPDP